jgi:MOSC domain-containing protein YiiM
MMTVMTSLHLPLEELAAGLGALPPSPADHGTLDLIVVRAAEDVRETPDRVSLSSRFGVADDHWSRGRYASKPEMQLSLINTGVLDLVAAGDRSRWPLAGDNLVVDLDLSHANLPVGTRLAIGSSVIEISAKAHRGCAKFSARYESQAREFVNLGDGPDRRLRGAYATVVEDGEVTVGDLISKT